MGWQPIETAPRDGTEVDLWHFAGFRKTDIHWDVRCGCWASVHHDSEFTHWMLPPDPPTP